MTFVFSRAGNNLLHPHEHARQSHLRQPAGARQGEQQDFVHLPLPVLLGPATKIPAADQAGFVVVRAEIGRPGMRYLDRNQGDIGFPVLRRDDGRDLLVGLEFDHQVDFLAHQHIRVALRDLGVVPVVHEMSSTPSACAAR